MLFINSWKLCWRRLSIAKKVMKKRFNKQLRMTEKDEEAFKKAEECHM